MTQEAKEHRFTAAITSKGKQGNGWKMEFDWKLPGSKFPFVLYGKDMEDVEGWNIGERPEVVIAQGTLKADKDGRYPSDYFWDLVSLEDPTKASYEDEPTPSRPTPIVGRSQQERKPTPPEEPQPVPQALGACQNHAMAFIESGILPVPEGRDPINWLWELRDTIYRGVNQRPYQVAHYCYEHKTPRILSKKGVWGHVLPDGKGCVEPTTAPTAPGAQEPMRRRQTCRNRPQSPP